MHQIFKSMFFRFLFRELLNNGLRYPESGPWGRPEAAAAVTKKNVAGMNPPRPAGAPMKKLQQRDTSLTWPQQRAQTRRQRHLFIGRRNNNNNLQTEATTTTNPDSNSRHRLCIPRQLLRFITLRVTGVPWLVLRRVIPAPLLHF